MTVFSRTLSLVLLAGIGVGAMIAVGQSYGIGFHSAWKLYRLWWLLSPLYGPAAILFVGIVSLVGRRIDRALERFSPRLHTWGGKALKMIALAVGFAVSGYFGARQRNPMLAEPPRVEALSRSAADQSHVLGEVSTTGKTLLRQLGTTQTELEDAKKQLSITLANLDKQRDAAGEVTEELKRIDARGQQIALKTEELERILGGREPITREDLRRSNNNSLLYGLMIGFLTSLAATGAYGALSKGKANAILPGAGGCAPQ